MIKTILFWTPRIGEADWSIGVGQTPFNGCEYDNCQYSSDKSMLREADMLLFYCQEMPEFPRVRYGHQLYVHLTREAPMNANINGYGMYGEAINITMSYRKDGNLRAPYFTMVSRENPEEVHVPRVPFNNRSRSIAWMVSHCHTESRRELYVHELQKYIDVDIYGACGNLTCQDTTSYKLYEDCFTMFEKTYKFYLAVENNICKDYHTEKLLNVLEHEIVPIVLGGDDYKSDYPEHSLIDIKDYPHPRDLAAYLKALTEDEYTRFLQWKATHVTVHAQDSCVLCEFLNNSTYTRGEQIVPPSYGQSYTKWWYDSCHNNIMDDLREKGGW
jgi:alpha-1,3-fucosyltransferase